MVACSTRIAGPVAIRRGGEVLDVYAYDFYTLSRFLLLTMGHGSYLDMNMNLANFVP